MEQPEEVYFLCKDIKETCSRLSKDHFDNELMLNEGILLTTLMAYYEAVFEKTKNGTRLFNAVKLIEMMTYYKPIHICRKRPGPYNAKFHVYCTPMELVVNQLVGFAVFYAHLKVDDLLRILRPLTRLFLERAATQQQVSFLDIHVLLRRNLHKNF